MLQELKNFLNKTQTENGAVTLKSSTDALVDLFALGGAYRDKSEQDIAILFRAAYRQDKELAMKTLFYLRDVRGGQGERRFFRIAMADLTTYDSEAVRGVLPLIPEYGRWDDLLALLFSSVMEDVLEIVVQQFKEDQRNHAKGRPISLLAKWLPSVSVRSPEQKVKLELVMNALKMRPVTYRKVLSKLRRSLALVETKLTEKKYQEIHYQTLPSIAGMKYRQAFYRNDTERYEAFLEQLKAGKTTVNTGTLYPSDIVGKVLQSSMIQSHRALYNGMWENLPDYIGDRSENSVAVVDVSGSMMGRPMEVAIALGIYLSERNNSAFRNHFITFSEKPQLCELVGRDFVDKVRNLSRASWGYNTDLEQVFQVILTVAKKNRLSQEQMIDKLYIISDMEFDAAVGHAEQGFNRETLFKTLQKKMNRAGYRMPEIIFWNVHARQQQIPVSADEKYVKLVSGYSPTLFKDLIENNTISPTDFMLKVILSQRYEPIKVA